MGTLQRALLAVLRPVLREARVRSANLVAPHFVHLELEGSALAAARFAPGNKIRVLVDGELRTYTPFAVDAARGRCQLLVYLHGDAPGAIWARSARPGDLVRVFGPQGSIEATGPTVVVGDETSIGLACALSSLPHPTRSVLEVGDTHEAADVASHLGLRGIRFVERSAVDLHLAAVEAAVREALAVRSASMLLLTGRARTIQALRAALRSRPTPHAGQRAKAYWAAGKRGLD